MEKGAVRPRACQGASLFGALGGYACPIRGGARNAVTLASIAERSCRGDTGGASVEVGGRARLGVVAKPALKLVRPSPVGAAPDPLRALASRAAEGDGDAIHAL